MKLPAALLTILACLISSCRETPRMLVVCADPNNLPYSNRQQQGFENALARMIAHDLHAELRYIWRPQRRGAIRETLNTGKCDLIPGIASGHEMVLTTRPWYRSTYVIVTRASEALDIASFEDLRLRRLRVGVQLIGDDGINTPPAHALARRGIVENVRGFMVQGDYRKGDPQDAIFTALTRGDIDVSFVWGPTAGFWAKRHPGEIVLRNSPPSGGPALPMQFAVAAGVRKGNAELARAVDASLSRRRDDIARLLQGFQIPVVGAGPGPAANEQAGAKPAVIAAQTRPE